MAKKTFILPKEFTEKWLKALRSGKYIQTSNTLINDNADEYCCLGVACKLVDIEDEYLVSYGSPYEVRDDNGEEVDFQDLPKQLMGGGTESYDIASLLMSLNDGMSVGTKKLYTDKYPTIKFTSALVKGGMIRYTFDEIATFVETNCELV